MKHIHFIAITIFFTAILPGVFLLSRRTATPAHLSDAGYLFVPSKELPKISEAYYRMVFRPVRVTVSHRIG
jgi:hypothetical protein